MFILKPTYFSNFRALCFGVSLKILLTYLQILDCGSIVHLKEFVSRLRIQALILAFECEIRKKVQFGEVVVYVSEAKINVFVLFSFFICRALNLNFAAFNGLTRGVLLPRFFA